MTKKILITISITIGILLLLVALASCRIRSSTTTTSTGTASSTTEVSQSKRDTVVVSWRDTIRTYSVKDTTYYIHHYTTNDIHHYNELTQTIKRDTVFLQTKTYEVKPRQKQMRLVDWLLAIAISAAISIAVILYLKAKVKQS